MATPSSTENTYRHTIRSSSNTGLSCATAWNIASAISFRTKKERGRGRRKSFSWRRLLGRGRIEQNKRGGARLGINVKQQSIEIQYMAEGGEAKSKAKKGTRRIKAAMTCVAYLRPPFRTIEPLTSSRIWTGVGPLLGHGSWSLLSILGNPKFEQI